MFATTRQNISRPSRSKPARKARRFADRFILDANRENLGINFDPANMILYGTGDPIKALDILGAHVLSVHAKDGDWPDSHPGALGKERPLGEGAVGIERFCGSCAYGFRGANRWRARGQRRRGQAERDPPRS